KSAVAAASLSILPISRVSLFFQNQRTATSSLSRLSQFSASFSFHSPENDDETLFLLAPPAGETTRRQPSSLSLVLPSSFSLAIHCLSVTATGMAAEPRRRRSIEVGFGREGKKGGEPLLPATRTVTPIWPFGEFLYLFRFS
ncbi:unnamed protein product, partial [Linum tenue]